MGNYPIFGLPRGVRILEAVVRRVWYTKIGAIRRRIGEARVSSPGSVRCSLVFGISRRLGS